VCIQEWGRNGCWWVRVSFGGWWKGSGIKMGIVAQLCELTKRQQDRTLHKGEVCGSVSYSSVTVFKSIRKPLGTHGKVLSRRWWLGQISPWWKCQQWTEREQRTLVTPVRHKLELNQGSGSWNGEKGRF
jgi:hypothetical protein